jgi:hypothetical protein
LIVARDDRHQKYNSDQFGFDYGQINSKIEIADLSKWLHSREAPVSRSQALSQNHKNAHYIEFHRRSIFYGSNIKRSSDCDSTAAMLTICELKHDSRAIKNPFQSIKW